MCLHTYICINIYVHVLPGLIVDFQLFVICFHSAADHFRSKDYEMSAEMFEKSMLYIPYDIENRILRGKGFRVLGLCHLGLSRLDQALEYINEAEKVFLSTLSWTSVLRDYLYLACRSCESK